MPLVGRHQLIVVLRASFRSARADSVTVIRPLTSVSTVSTYFDATGRSLAAPTIGAGRDEWLPVWYTSATAVRHWLVARMPSDTLALIV